MENKELKLTITIEPVDASIDQEEAVALATDLRKYLEELSLEHVNIEQETLPAEPGTMSIVGDLLAMVKTVFEGTDALDGMVDNFGPFLDNAHKILSGLLVWCHLRVRLKGDNKLKKPSEVSTAKPAADVVINAGDNRISISEFERLEQEERDILLKKIMGLH